MVIVAADTAHQLKDGKVSTKEYPRFLHDPRAKKLTKFISIGGYSPEVRVFVRLGVLLVLLYCAIDMWLVYVVS